MKSLVRAFALPNSLVAIFALGPWAPPASSQGSCQVETLAKHLDAGLPGPRLRTPDGAPILGRPFSFGVSGGPAGASGVLLLGLNEVPTFLPQFGVTIFPASPSFNTPFTLDASGSALGLRQMAAIDPALCGATGAAQAAIFDPNGLLFTNGLHLALGVVGTRALPGLASPQQDEVTTLATGDLDQDGILDIITGNRALGTYSVALGRGDGGFDVTYTGSTGGTIESSIIADFNGNGFPDVAIGVSGASGGVRAFLGLGDGTLGVEKTLPYGSLPKRMAATDIDGDGKQDLLVVIGGSAQVLVYSNWAMGIFQTVQFIPCGSKSELTLADWNQDGFMDFAVTGYQNVYAVLGGPNGNFGSSLGTTLSTIQNPIASGDLNGDGLPDVVVNDLPVGATQARVKTLLGVGDGTFTLGPEFTTDAPFEVSALQLADLDGDGQLDVSYLTLRDRWWIALGNGDGSFAPPVLRSLNPTAADPVVADLDADGRLDVLAGHRDTPFVAFYRGLGGTELADVDLLPTQIFPFATAAVDLNLDGAPDLVLPDVASTTVSTYLGDGEGGFSAGADFVGGEEMHSLEVADVDGDGIDDLALAYRLGVVVLPGDGLGGFQAPVVHTFAFDASSVAAGDLNGDGIVDMAATLDTADQVALLRGLGGGAFAAPSTFPTGAAPSAIRIRDLDQDGHQDILVSAAGSASLVVHWGLGGGDFSAPMSIAIGAAPDSIETGDLDGDGLPDLIAAVPSASQIAVVLGTGARTFAAPVFLASGDWPNSVHAADLDDDGNLDLVAVNQDTGLPDSGGTLVYHLGHGDGTFDTARFVAAQATSSLSGLTIGDFDLDGEPDVAAVEFGDGTIPLPGTAQVFLNLIGE